MEGPLPFGAISGGGIQTELYSSEPESDGFRSAAPFQMLRGCRMPGCSVWVVPTFICQHSSFCAPDLPEPAAGANHKTFVLSYMSVRFARLHSMSLHALLEIKSWRLWQTLRDWDCQVTGHMACSLKCVVLQAPQIILYL